MPDNAQSNREATSAAGEAPSREDLAWLVCPVCRSGLELVEGDRQAAATIRCTGCERRYPVVDGLPVLLADRASLTSATKV